MKPAFYVKNASITKHTKITIIGILLERTIAVAVIVEKKILGRTI